jgi:phage/conjugal plasmid C-4 type zinc finger TraR family protein
MGHMVFEIRPRVNWNKGTAVGWIKDKLSRPDAQAINVGDDVTDEDAFGALPDGITIKVGEMKVGETVETAARYHVKGPGEVRRFLDWIDGVLTARSRLPAGEGTAFCVECGEEIPLARRKVLPGATTCVECQSGLDTREVPSMINRRGSKDSQLR